MKERYREEEGDEREVKKDGDGHSDSRLFGQRSAILSSLR
jgi:hypothetical protein